MAHPGSRFARALLGERLGAGLADDDDVNLAGILHLVLDLLRDVMREHGRLGVVDGIRLDHDANLAAGLHGRRVRSTPSWELAISSSFSRRLM